MPHRRLTPRQTHPLIWVAAILGAIIAIAVIVTGLVIFIGYLILRPKLPYFQVSYAHIDKLDYDQTGLLDTQITLNIDAVNDNKKVHATFYNVKFLVSFDQVPIAHLAAEEFDVLKNSTLPLSYLIQSSSIPLGPRVMDSLNDSLKRFQVILNLKGNARTRWKAGIIGFVKFSTHLDCELIFSTNGTYISPPCNSKSD